MAARSPQKATRPSDNTSTLWKPANTSAEGWWMVQITAALHFCAMLSSNVTMAAAAAESKPEVGSSRMITRGRLTSATARERRLRWPPESPLKRKPPALVSWQEVRPVTERSSSTSALSPSASSSGRKFLNANSRCCRGFMVGHRLSSRGT